MAHFATLVTEDHVPGALALGQSLFENSGYSNDIQYHILTPEGISPAAREKLFNLPFSVECYDESWNVDYACPNEYVPREKYTNQYKFNVFRLPADKVTYLDADILCVGDVTAIDDMRELSVVMNLGKNGYSAFNERVIFNSGMFVCEPSSETFQELQEFGREWDRPIERGDQPIMNEFYLRLYPDRVNYLSPGWNVIQPWRFKSRRLWNAARREGMKFLHYTHAKPWRSYWPTSKEDLYFLWSKLHKKHILYRKLQSMWWPYYRRSLE